jgi:predicted alpha/beta-fold hydrolase
MTFQSAPLYRNGHIATILPSLFRKLPAISYQRMRIDTKDGDFFDTDWLVHQPQSKKLLILLHGLEGSSSQHYITSHARFFFDQGFDICAMNFRSCSGEMNRTTRLYHSGETEDLRYLLKQNCTSNYHDIYLIGFSLGGNVLMKFLGEESSTISSKIKAAVAFSIPMDLRSSSYKMAGGFNRIYAYQFMLSLRQKVDYLRTTHQLDYLQDFKLTQLKTFLDFDELVTAPLHGFTSGEDYWQKSSSLPYLPYINVPALVINAKNDPLLGNACFPGADDINNPLVKLLYPRHGGHLGFVDSGLYSMSWMENQALKFFERL